MRLQSRLHVVHARVPQQRLVCRVRAVPFRPAVEAVPGVPGLPGAPEVNQRPRLSTAKTVASDIIEMVSACTPAEYQMALTLATAIYFKAQFGDDLESAYRMHVENLRAAMEELDKQNVLDLFSVDVTEFLG
jgi:hypothetical protein